MKTKWILYTLAISALVGSLSQNIYTLFGKYFLVFVLSCVTRDRRNIPSFLFYSLFLMAKVSNASATYRS
ncbi:hypothetical protein EEL32_09055 [Brevibacillus laterosporus]|nr:hypothetical protein [Brevibacillus laterosporus]TPG88304.1 hypothetical protein EEL32_09055 [Brevibacillus laterosporus]